MGLGILMKASYHISLQTDKPPPTQEQPKELAGFSNMDFGRRTRIHQALLV